MTKINYDLFVVPFAVVIKFSHNAKGAT